MKLLLSAYACAPNLGSDHGVGWNWATEARKLGHEVWVLVSPAHHDSITAACRDKSELEGIHWIFPEVRGWPLKQGVEPKWEQTYFVLWQRVALRHARGLHRQVRFDAIHHLTWAGIRAPTFLGGLGVPLIIGPAGGGETSPFSLRDELPLRGKLLEIIRDISNHTIILNPLVRSGYNKAAVIFVSTKDTQNLFTGALREKTITFLGPNLPELPEASPRRIWNDPPKFLYVGRLLHWKAVHIALHALALVAKEFPGARLSIRGDGPERSRLEEDIRRHNLQGQVDFIPRLPAEKLAELYVTHDLLLFPTLHDSGGFAVLEAMSHGMPIVCLDLGGPKEIATSSSGLIIKTNGRNTTQVASAMADEMVRLLRAPEKMTELSTGGIARAKEFVSARRVKEFYDRAAPYLT